MAINAEHIREAREHTVGSRRRTRAHVVVTHELNAKSRSLYELFDLAHTVDPAYLEEASRALAEDIIADADLLIRELENIKAFALRQLAKLPLPTK